MIQNLEPIQIKLNSRHPFYTYTFIIISMKSMTYIYITRFISLVNYFQSNYLLQFARFSLNILIQLRICVI